MRALAAPLDFEYFSKKGCFRSFEWEKTNFTIFATPQEKFWKNLLVDPAKDPSDDHKKKPNLTQTKLRAQWHGQPKILGGSKCLILGKQQYFA